MIKIIELLKKNIGQLTIVFGLLTFFSICATLSPIRENGKLINIIIWNLTTITPFLIFFFIWLHKQGNPINKIKNSFTENKFVYFVLGITAIFRILQFGTLARWDSEVYLMNIIDGCKTFDFTIPSYIESFRYASHSSIGYSVFVSIGEYITPNSPLGVMIANLIISLFGVYFVYEILNHFFSNSKLNLALGALLFSVEPMLLGTSSTINLEFPIAIFLVYILYMHIKKYNVLFTLFCCVLVFSKESGVFFLAIYLIVYILAQFLTLEGDFKEKFLLLCDDAKIWGAYIGCQLFVFYYIYQQRSNLSSWQNGMFTGEKSKTPTINYIGINFNYIILKLKTILFLNYYWIFTIIVVTGFIITITMWCRKKCLKSNIKKYLTVISYIFSALGVFAFSCIYVTYNNPRYLMGYFTALILVAIFLLFGIVKNKKILSITLTLLILLCIVQSYTNIDPLSTLIFDKADTGSNCSMIFPVYNNNPFWADQGVYNYQYSFIDKSFDKILKETRYDDQTSIIEWKNSSEHLPIYIKGRYMELYWDSEKQKRTINTNDSTIKINLQYKDTIIDSISKNIIGNKAILFINPIYNTNTEQNEALTVLGEVYNISNRHEASVFMQGKTYYYELTLK